MSKLICRKRWRLWRECWLVRCITWTWVICRWTDWASKRRRDRELEPDTATPVCFLSVSASSDSWMFSAALLIAGPERVCAMTLFIFIVFYAASRGQNSLSRPYLCFAGEVRLPVNFHVARSWLCYVCWQKFRQCSLYQQVESSKYFVPWVSRMLQE